MKWSVPNQFIKLPTCYWVSIKYCSQVPTNFNETRRISTIFVWWIFLCHRFFDTLYRTLKGSQTQTYRSTSISHFVDEYISGMPESLVKMYCLRCNMKNLVMPYPYIRIFNLNCWFNLEVAHGELLLTFSHLI